MTPFFMMHFIDVNYLAVSLQYSVLDYLSDFIHLLYGTAGVYGVVSSPASVREGINHFLAGYIPAENLRFRATEINFKIQDTPIDFKDEHKKTNRKKVYHYPAMSKSFGGFHLNVEAGSFQESEIVVMLGQNGTGKTTFIKLLAGRLQPDDNGDAPPKLVVSYKPQTIATTFDGTVAALLKKHISCSMDHPQFKHDVLKPMKIEPLLDHRVSTLSGGELQRVAIVLALGKPAGIFSNHSNACIWYSCFMLASMI
jgi:ATP-binding cassette subfamily E protein 1